MALFKFTRNILANEPIDVYNNGQMIRDFTYIDDIVEGVVHALANVAAPISRGAVTIQTRPAVMRLTVCSMSAIISLSCWSTALPCWKNASAPVV